MTTVSCAFGRRRSDDLIIVDFHRHRAILRKPTKYVVGVPLEQIEPGIGNAYVAMILFHRDWKNMYFVNNRIGWTDDQYFDFADKRLAGLKILDP